MQAVDVCNHLGEFCNRLGECCKRTGKLSSDGGCRCKKLRIDTDDVFLKTSFGVVFVWDSAVHMIIYITITK